MKPFGEWLSDLSKELQESSPSGEAPPDEEKDFNPDDLSLPPGLKYCCVQGDLLMVPECVEPIYDHAGMTIGFEAKCYNCGDWSELPCDIKDIEGDASFEHYCGKGPSCCP